MSKWNIGDKYWTFYTEAEIYGEVYWPFIKLKQLEIYHPSQLRSAEQVYYFKTKNEAVDAIIAELEKLKEH